MCVWDYIYVCVCETTFMYVCVRLHSCMWDYIYVCVFETTFMCVCLRLHSRMFVWTMCTNNLSNYEITKIKVVDLHELFNFGIHYFFNWNDLGVQILVRTCYFFKFQIWKVHILSNDKMTKIKVVDLDELNNFCIHHFYIWNHLGFENLVWTCQILNFKMCKTLLHPSLIKLKWWSMILEIFRKENHHIWS